nr:YqzL family protein [Pseudalkalibacillus caeni]
MEHFAWKVFCMTGDVDTYLLMKEMEENEVEIPPQLGEEQLELDPPIT